MTEKAHELESPRPVLVVVKVHRSSSRDGGVGWEITVTDGATDDDVRETVAKAVAGHRQLAAELLPAGGGQA